MSKEYDELKKEIEKVKKIFISGSRASGKTSLLRLLDGNPILA